MIPEDPAFILSSSLVAAAYEHLQSLLRFPPVTLGSANPPRKNGVYAFRQEGEILYVGEASSPSGLRGRILNKHLAGDEGHVLQNLFALSHPDRVARRDHMKTVIRVQWVEVPDSLLASVVEKLAIAGLAPPLNKAVQKRSFR
ncbi:hypothetical protein ASE61_04950 [Bosea sp. Root670]|uniref:hypothetical protein n=1 Tax=Bosea sp. Root670 TaxID=1736583 RepID=UPI000715E2C8|nr:hypothetical protein [Bosea sp. Root670]KRE08898.1 hypothetical protein ASE61_04950 [Bosea sp. Root670]